MSEKILDIKEERLSFFTPAGEVKALVGHSEDMDTYGIYSHALTGEDTETAQAVNGMFLKLLHAGK